MKGLFEAAGADHQLNYLDVADEVCMARLGARNAQADHALAATDEQFDLITSHLVVPSAEKDFNLVIHQP